MKFLTRVQTHDGQLHASKDAAMRHLDKLYGETICSLTSRMITETDGKYTRLQEFIDGNLDSFRRLMTIKEDMTVEENDDDE